MSGARDIRSTGQAVRCTARRTRAARSSKPMRAAALRRSRSRSSELAELRACDVLRGRQHRVDGVPAGVAEGITPDRRNCVRRDSTSGTS